jgi:hypothetical protein
VHPYTGSLLCEFHKLRVEIESLTVELAPEVFKVLAGSTRNIKEAPGLTDPTTNGVPNPCRFAGVVLQGIGEIVEVGRLVEHVQKSDRRDEAIVSLPPYAIGSLGRFSTIGIVPWAKEVLPGNRRQYRVVYVVNP